MNKDLTKLFVCISENRLFFYETNMTAFHKGITEKLGHLRSRQWLDTHLTIGSCITFIVSDIEYHFFKIK